MDILATDPRFPRFVALLIGFLLVVLWLRAQPEWLLVVLPLFALTFLGFDRLADGSAALVESGDLARLGVGAILMAGPAFAVGFALGRRARRPDQDVARAPVEVSPTRTEDTVALPRPEPTTRP
jgi:hypothetical protein